MNRRDLQKLALIRMEEAQSLLKDSLYDGAYYLAGYAIESALKACIAKRTKRYEFPDKTRVNKSYTHDLNTLVDIAGIRPDLDQRVKQDPAFATNWTLAKDWSEDARYARHTELTAKDLIRAVSDHQSGVLAWLKTYW